MKGVTGNAYPELTKKEETGMVIFTIIGIIVVAFILLALVQCVG